MIKLLILLSLVFTGCFNQDSKIYITTYKQKEVLDLNHASKEQLILLPNVGEVKAEKIIESRNKKIFDSISDFQSRHLIGDTTFNDIKEDIYVDTRVD